MRISICIAALILIAGGVIGWRDHNRLSAARESGRLPSEKTETPPVTASPEGKSIDREAEDRRAAMELLEGLKSFVGRDSAEPEAVKKAVSEIQERLESMNSNQAEFILRESMEGRGINGFPGPLVFNCCLAKLATDRPLKAIELFSIYQQKWPDNPHAREIGGQIIGDSLITMAKDDPAAAAAWLRSEGKDRKFREQISESTRRAVLFNVAGKDPVQAFRMIGELDFKADAPALGSVVRAARTEEERRQMLPALRNHLEGIPDEKTRQEALGIAFEAFAERLVPEGPAAVGRWATAAALSPEETVAFVAGVISGKTDTTMTTGWMDWIAREASPEKLDGPLRKLFAAWTAADYQAAGGWLAASPAGPVREISIQAYAEEAAKYDPETAEKWALVVPSKSRREATLKNVLANWPDREPGDKEAAADFARRHGLR